MALGIVTLAVLCAQLPAQPPTGSGFAGSWTGSARLTNEWGASSCVYQGDAMPPAVTLEIVQDPAGAEVTLVLDVPNAIGAGCPALKKRYESLDARISGSALAFSDPAGHSWSLALRGAAVQGIVAWKGGASDQPLAQGFSGPAGTPLTRLSGEVALTRTGAAPPSAAGARGSVAAASAGAAGAPGSPLAASSPAPQKATLGGVLGGFGAIIAANVVAVGAIVAVNVLAEDTTPPSTEPDPDAVKCSPRYCNNVCLCTNTLGLPPETVRGGDCGITSLGVTLAGVCDVPGKLPCARNLSCNDVGEQSVCENSSGNCPF